MSGPGTVGSLPFSDGRITATCRVSPESFQPSRQPAVTLIAAAQVNRAEQIMRRQGGRLPRAAGDGDHTRVTPGVQGFSAMFIWLYRPSMHTASVAPMGRTPRQ